MENALLRTISADSVRSMSAEPADRDTLGVATKIVDAVKARGESALAEFASRFEEVKQGDPLYLGKKEIEAARGAISKGDLALLERTASRIYDFAADQLRSISDMERPIPGGVAGQQVSPVERAGCYAPGGRFPLPSSVLMTAVTANAAGVKSVWVASPKPSPIVLAAASCAQVDGVLSTGGAQAIAALAYGVGPIPECDVIVGPGNRFVTAAKQIVFGKVGIDMLAGPSELLVLADATANPATIAADILAQAEHDPDARPILVSLDAELVNAVNEALALQLAELPTRRNAMGALENGFAVVAGDLSEAIEISDRVAPEHLEVCCENAAEVGERCNHYGALFIGEGTAEVIGDYGAGPNHTLPTGGTARYTGGLSVFDFLRIRTYIKIDNPEASRPLYEDAVRLAELEGLAGHAESARRRIEKS